ncbi:HD domain-containing protein [Cystobacter fuscus]|uniref:HD domain-containing protein n=1 Tax=Cystobacter fuscus TaxID=43 RepID=UPI0037C0AECD
MRMALLHDASEARAGDITPHDGVSREEKLRRDGSRGPLLAPARSSSTVRNSAASELAPCAALTPCSWGGLPRLPFASLSAHGSPSTHRAPRAGPCVRPVSIRASSNTTQ